MQNKITMNMVQAHLLAKEVDKKKNEMVEGVRREFEDSVREMAEKLNILDVDNFADHITRSALDFATHEIAGTKMMLPEHSTDEIEILRSVMAEDGVYTGSTSLSIHCGEKTSEDLSSDEACGVAK